MTNIRDIEAAIERLSSDDLAAFRKWYLEFDADAWDRQLETDVQAGALDALANEAPADLREGRCTDL